MCPPLLYEALFPRHAALLLLRLPHVLGGEMLPLLLTPKRFQDERGWFSEIYNASRWAQAGIVESFVQDNHSFSAELRTLRGLHFQAEPYGQAKLVRCVVGSVWDVVVDIRNGSPTWGTWRAATLTAAAGEQMYVPVGFAHGFLTLEAGCEVHYKTSEFYAPSHERAIAWDDPDLAIPWPVAGSQPILSTKDSKAPGLSDLESTFVYAGAPFETLEVVSP